MIRSLFAWAVPALVVLAAPVRAGDEPERSAAGEYRDRKSFEMFHGLLLGEDGTFQYALAVGALDQRSQGSWSQEGNVVTLTTTPTPVAPEFRQDPADPAPEAPFVLVTWPGGDGIAGITVRLGCADESELVDQVQYDGWSPQPGACPDPQWIELAEPIHDIRSPRYPLTPAARGLRFVLVPNDFGVVDLTGTTGVLEGDELVLQIREYRVVFERKGEP